MTTKPRHGTLNRRHGAGNRLSNRLAEQDRLERELRDALEQLDGSGGAIPTVGTRNPRQARLRLVTVVLFSVRKGTSGTIKRWEYTAPASTWDCEAEHLARLAARAAGYTIHAHLDTFREQRP